MRTAYCPDGEKEIGCGSVGNVDGHVPGHQYHDVDVVISCITTPEGRLSAPYRCHVCESWGSAQGFDEEAGRNEVVVRASNVSAVVGDARDRGIAAGIEGVALKYLTQALSEAEDTAFNVVRRDNEESWLLAHSVKEEVVAVVTAGPVGAATAAVRLTAGEIDELFDAIDDSIRHWEMCGGDAEENARYARTIAGLQAIAHKLDDVREQMENDKHRGGE